MGRSRCTYCAMRGGSSVLLLSAAGAGNSATLHSGRWEVGHRTPGSRHVHTAPQAIPGSWGCPSPQSVPPPSFALPPSTLLPPRTAPPALLPRPAPPAQTLTRLLPCLAWCMSFAGVKPRKPRAGLRGNAHGVGCPWDSSPEPCVGNTQGVPTTHIPARPPAFGAGVG
jgi:hypothetical protein